MEWTNGTPSFEGRNKYVALIMEGIDGETPHVGFVYGQLEKLEWALSRRKYHSWIMGGRKGPRPPEEGLVPYIRIPGLGSDLPLSNLKSIRWSPLDFTDWVANK